MLKELKTKAVVCDGDACDEVFTDVVELSAETAYSLARLNGWLISSGRDLCPACRLKAEPLSREEMIAEVASRR